MSQVPIELSPYQRDNAGRLSVKFEKLLILIAQKWIQFKAKKIPI